MAHIEGGKDKRLFVHTLCLLSEPTQAWEGRQAGAGACTSQVASLWLWHDGKRAGQGKSRSGCGKRAGTHACC
jgi:hypothetical protein